jgi:hypothetical protein
MKQCDMAEREEDVMIPLATTTHTDAGTCIKSHVLPIARDSGTDLAMSSRRQLHHGALDSRVAASQMPTHQFTWAGHANAQKDIRIPALTTHSTGFWHRFGGVQL